jgi:branched-chain amino acid aminotransferase
MAAGRDGRLKEAFGAGTAAVISPVGRIVYKDETVQVGDGGIGDYAMKLYNEITSVQYGQKADARGWIETVD